MVSLGILMQYRAISRIGRASYQGAFRGHNLLLLENP